MNKDTTTAIITTGLLPVPSVLGGAVESLTQNFIDENERQKKAQLVVYSVFTPEAASRADQYDHTDFVFIKIPKFVAWLDRIVYGILHILIKTQRISSFRAGFQRIYFMQSVSRRIAKNNHEKILFENAIVQMHLLRWHRNSRRYEGRVYVHVHKEITNFFGVRRYLADANVITVSEFVKNSLIAKMNSSNDRQLPRSISVLRNAVDNKKFTAITRVNASRQLHHKYNIAASKRILLFSGRLTPEKGIDVLIKALGRIENDNYQLLVVGSSFFGTDITSPFLKELRQLVQPYLERVTFTGFVDYSQMPVIYRGADIAVLPSVWNDAAPLTVIESITAGLPVITTNRGGIPEYASDKTAILLETDDHLERNLAQAIDKLLVDENTLQDMRQSSRVVAKNMTLNGYYNDLLRKLDVDD